MPTSSSAANVEKRRTFRSQTPARSTERADSTFLTIESALHDKRLTKRSHSTLSSASLTKSQKSFIHDPITLETSIDGTVHALRTHEEKELHPDRINLDRRGLNSFPIIDGQLKLRLLSLQHNLITNLEGLQPQSFPFLVFLDIYDNQLESMAYLDGLENLRVLLLGKNRLKKIEGLGQLRKIEVLDLHGNQITAISGLEEQVELKVLNLAGNHLKYVGTHDFQGLGALQELNLRRNKLRKLLGFGETTSLAKLFISNNDLQTVEDMASLAKATSLKEIAIDNNPVFQGGDCVSFLVSYLPQLIKLNTMQVTEQVRKSGMAWRRNKETTNSAFMDLTSDVCLNVRREEIISNARTNWELLRTQTKCLTKPNLLNLTSSKNLNIDSDLILTGLAGRMKIKSQKVRVPIILNKKLLRTSSQETDNSQNTSSSSEYTRLPPILVPIIKKMEQKSDSSSLKGSISSIGPNIDSSVSSICSENEISSSSTCSSPKPPELEPTPNEHPADDIEKVEESALLGSSGETKTQRPQIKSATQHVRMCQKWQGRAATAKTTRKASPNAIKDREQGGDYLIEIAGRFLNVYGQCALRFIDKTWSATKANDVTAVRFTYVNFNTMSSVLNRIKQRFPNIEHFIFKETNICFLGQINALAEVQGLSALTIEADGNPILTKKWRSYAIYRLSHWGLTLINDERVTEEEIKQANDEFQSLSDLVLFSLPNLLLHPLLSRLRLDLNASSEKNIKKWLLSSDPELRSVVSKEALQWKKNTTLIQEDQALRIKAKVHISQLLDEMANSVKKLRLLDEKWPQILNEFVRNALLDYSQLDMYMKQQILELNR